MTQARCYLCRRAASLPSPDRIDCHGCGNWRFDADHLQPEHFEQASPQTLAALSHRTRVDFNATKVRQWIFDNDLTTEISLPSNQQLIVNALAYLNGVVPGTETTIDQLPPDFQATIGASSHDQAMDVVEFLVGEGWARAIDASSKGRRSFLKVGLTFAGKLAVERSAAPDDNSPNQPIGFAMPGGEPQ